MHETINTYDSFSFVNIHFKLQSAIFKYKDICVSFKPVLRESTQLQLSLFVAGKCILLLNPCIALEASGIIGNVKEKFQMCHLLKKLGSQKTDGFLFFFLRR